MTVNTGALHYSDYYYWTTIGINQTEATHEARTKQDLLTLRGLTLHTTDVDQSLCLFMYLQACSLTGCLLFNINSIYYLFLSAAIDPCAIIP